MTTHPAHRAPASPAAPTPLRLLPWRSPEGKPCYLSTDDDGSYLSRLADDMEAMQLATAEDVLATAEDVLGLTRAILDDPASPSTEVRYAGLRLAECLADALAVAESRGRRVPTPGTPGADEGDAVGEQPVRTPGSGLWS